MRQHHDLGERREVAAVLSRDLLADSECFDPVKAIGPLFPEADRHSGGGPVLDDLPRQVEGLFGLRVTAGQLVDLDGLQSLAGDGLAAVDDGLKGGTADELGEAADRAVGAFVEVAVEFEQATGFVLVES